MSDYVLLGLPDCLLDLPIIRLLICSLLEIKTCHHFVKSWLLLLLELLLFLEH